MKAEFMGLGKALHSCSFSTESHALLRANAHLPTARLREKRALQGFVVKLQRTYKNLSIHADFFAFGHRRPTTA
jgi:hypothetical protein